jgi:hypothetical protein
MGGWKHENIERTSPANERDKNSSGSLFRVDIHSHADESALVAFPDQAKVWAQPII